MRIRIAQRHHRRCSRQAGIGLVELMVSIAIGLLLVIMVTGYHLSSRQSYQLSVIASEITNSQRYAVQSLIRQVRLAGYSDSWDSPGANFPSVTGSEDIPEFEAGQILASDNADEVWLRMQGAALNYQPIVTCSNIKIPVADEVDAPIVALVHVYVDENATLSCETRVDGDTNEIPLLNGVEEIAFSYLDQSNEFQPHSTVDWRSVRAVQLDLLIRSEATTYGAPVEQTYNWQGAILTFDDRHMRSRLTRTVALRNAGGG